ncbi:MAG: hypothetical protein LBK99_18315 [Opitutaceae bacterium]|jgi:hypothetical protein|nr:hypothetical protein [Opitutaceae bacterium]
MTANNNNTMTTTKNSLLALVVLLVAGAGNSIHAAGIAPDAVMLTPVSSRVLNIAQPTLTRSGNGIVLSGAVTKQPTAQRTTGTHLDVVFFNATGATLHRQTVQYAPRELHPLTRAKVKRTGHYTLSLPELPAGTTRIQVAAHSGPHA